MNAQSNAGENPGDDYLRSGGYLLRPVFRPAATSRAWRIDTRVAPASFGDNHLNFFRLASRGRP
jgi:hypothetical protein